MSQATTIRCRGVKVVEPGKMFKKKLVFFFEISTPFFTPTSLTEFAH